MLNDPFKLQQNIRNQQCDRDEKIIHVRLNNEKRHLLIVPWEEARRKDIDRNEMVVARHIAKLSSVVAPHQALAAISLPAVRITVTDGK